MFGDFYSPGVFKLLKNFGSRYFNKSSMLQVRLFQEHSCAILSSFNIMIIFNNALAEIKTKSADVVTNERTNGVLIILVNI